MAGSLGDLVLVGAGGFGGSVMRYALSGVVHRLVPLSAFPYGTLAVNGLGCLVIGLLVGLSDARNVIGPQMRLFLFLGVLGGFTTFSTFGHETLALLRDGERLAAAGNVVSQLVVGLGCAWAGYALASST